MRQWHSVWVKYSKTVGISAADTLGYSAALSSLGVEAQLGGSAIGRTWLSIETAVAKGGNSLKAFAKYAGVSANEFKQKWNTDPTGAFNGLLEGLNASENLTLALQELGIDNTQDIQVMQALVNSVDKVKESVQRSNNAWSENTALVNEFENKAGTTASQIQVMKNNLVEAGRSLGETFLPTINNGVTDIKNFAQGISKMSDGQKQALITTGKWVIGLGAAGKATSGVIKGIGNTADAFAKIKKAKEAGGVLAKFAPALTAIKGAAPYAAAGIIAVTAAVKIGKAAYDSWYKSQYKWTDGMSEQQNKIRKSMNSYKQLSDIQAQLKNYRLIIENPESSQEQVDNAKQKIQEIVELLAKEYDLKINVDDNDELDNAVNNLAQRSKNELERDYNSQQRKLNSLENRYKTDSAKLPDMKKQRQEADDLRTKFDTLSLSAETLRRKWYNSEIGQKEFMDGMVELGTQLGYSEDDIRNLSVSIDELQTKAIGEKNVKNELYKDLDGKITDLEGTVKHYEAISKEMANWASEGMALGVKEGDAGKGQSLVRQVIPKREKCQT